MRRRAALHGSTATSEAGAGPEAIGCHGALWLSSRVLACCPWALCLAFAAACSHTLCGAGKIWAQTLANRPNPRPTAGLSTPGKVNFTLLRTAVFSLSLPSVGAYCCTGPRMSPYVRMYAVVGSSLIVAAGAYKQWSTGSIFGSPSS